MHDRSNNLWWATAGERAVAPALSRQTKADIAIVGAGIMGTSAALALAEAGADVAVLEAGEVGEGASSRPGGFVVPHLSVGSPDEVRERIGDIADTLLPMVGRSAQAVFDRIRAYGIDCDARQGGWYHPAHAVGAMERVRDIVIQWERLGFPGEMLDARQTAERTSAQGYVGSWFAASGGTLHPLRYCRGMMDAAAARGARLYERSRVLGIEAQPGSYRLVTERGSLVADRVLVCTNGLSSALAPSMTATIVPLRVWQCATEPLPAEWTAHLFRNGECLSDTRRNLFTYRVDSEGRIVTGALDAFATSPKRSAAIMARRLKAMLGLPDVPRIQHMWWGDSSLSAPRYPASMVVNGGIISASACNARGIALSSVVGEALADHLLTGAPLPLPTLGGASRASAGLQSRLSNFYPHIAPLLDWLDARRHD
ncbi:NAD(P)/FAD-dependent oxidoreductase [Sphingomonas oryzagri]|uniref:FAD-dependent oxidoreductase n=1 Tax=Sphingomonas oryzagri TaxID=3042314 RepID=A0ABT6N452_9SPHN|nr:FAD-dependent oxidoreductase [Sphingomonas oryzagri]MDH7640012.1 FAD-dependent oxidoreductase [Sphingomonas oryzagri]